MFFVFVYFCFCVQPLQSLLCSQIVKLCAILFVQNQKNQMCFLWHDKLTVEGVDVLVLPCLLNSRSVDFRLDTSVTSVHDPGNLSLCVIVFFGFINTINNFVMSNAVKKQILLLDFELFKISHD